MKRHREYSLKEYIAMCNKVSAFEDDTTRLSTMQKHVIHNKLMDIRRMLKQIDYSTAPVFDESVSLIKKVYEDLVYHRSREIFQEHEKLSKKERVSEELYQRRLDMEMNDIAEGREIDFKMIKDLEEILFKSLYSKAMMKPQKIVENPYLPLCDLSYMTRQPVKSFSPSIWENIILWTGPSISLVCREFYHIVSKHRSLWRRLFMETSLCNTLEKLGMIEYDVVILPIQSLMTLVILDRHSSKARSVLYQFVSENGLRSPYTKCHGGIVFANCDKSCYPKHVFMLPRASRLITGDLNTDASYDYDNIRRRVSDIKHELVYFVRKSFPACVYQMK